MYFLRRGDAFQLFRRISVWRIAHNRQSLCYICANVCNFNAIWFATFSKDYLEYYMGLSFIRNHENRCEILITRRTSLPADA